MSLSISGYIEIIQRKMIMSMFITARRKSLVLKAFVENASTNNLCLTAHHAITGAVEVMVDHLLFSPQWVCVFSSCSPNKLCDPRAHAANLPETTLQQARVNAPSPQQRERCIDSPRVRTWGGVNAALVRPRRHPIYNWLR